MSIISIIGKPNVGKSTLFNRLIGKRDAVVHSTPNLTRDRHYGEFEWRDRIFTLIDTGGIGETQDTAFIKAVEEHREAITSDDYYIAEKLRPYKDKVILVVNKWDNQNDIITSDAYELGIDCIFPVSAEHQINTDSLKNEIYSMLPERKNRRVDGIRIAAVGKPNVGKSSFINAIMKDNRMIVSETPGTTRDAVDTHMNYKNLHFILVDTAGIRRASRIHEPTEYYTVLRSKLAMKNADIVVVIIDASEQISKQDKKIIEEAIDSLKPVMICFNKTDIIVSEDKNEYYKALRSEFPYAEHIPIINTSFKNNKNVFKVIDKSIELYNMLPLKIPSAQLNILLFEIIAHKKHPIKKNRRVRFYRLYQIRENPVKFVVESSLGANVDKSYKNYIINSIRASLPFNEINFRVYFRSKSK